MNKKVFNFSMGAALLLLASCGSSGNAVLEGYDFTGKGVLGKIPMGKAIQIATAREICYDFEAEGSKISNKKITEISKEEYMELGKKVNEMAQKEEDKFNHCLDDIQDDLKADSARLQAMKDINWEDKTNCGFKLNGVQLVENENSQYLERHDILLMFGVNEERVKQLPSGSPYYVFLDKNGKMLIGEGMEWGNGNLYKVRFKLDPVTKDLSKLMTLASSAETYHDAMSHCLYLDSISKILILDADEMLDYKPAMTITGVGPVQLGADLTKLPKSLPGIYDKCYDVQAPEADKYYSFETNKDEALFTAVGTPEGKIKYIEVATALLPIKFGNVVLRVDEPFSKIVGKYGKQISWSYNPETMSAIASFEAGKVTFEVFGDFFTETGTQKFLQLQNGAKNVSLVASDINPEEKLQYYKVQPAK